jgi:dipeptidyl aminopeptidase/acylaminoacyl peptidase
VAAKWTGPTSGRRLEGLPLRFEPGGTGIRDCYLQLGAELRVINGGPIPGELIGGHHPETGYVQSMPRPMLPEDMYLLRQVTDCAMHPDGIRVAFVVSWLDQATDTNRSVLWLHEGTAARQISYGHADSTPVFSPDGRWLAYLSAEQDERSQLKVMPLAGGEPIALTSADDGVGEPAWCADSTGLVFTAPVRPAHQRGKTAEQLAAQPEPRRITTVEYRYNARGWVHDRRRHVFATKLPTDGTKALAPTQLTDGDWDDWCPAPSPDGSTIAFISGRHKDREWAGGNDVWSIAPKGGRPKKLTSGGVWSHVTWHPSGQRLILIGTERRDVIDLETPYVLDLGDPRPRRLGDGEVSCTTHVAVTEHELFTNGIRRGSVHIDRYDLASGQRTIVVSGDRTVGNFALDASTGRVVFVSSSTNSPTELYERVGDMERPLSAASAPFRKVVALSPVTEATTHAADGTPVHVFVCAPRGRGKRPGLLYVHGGPLWQFGWGFNSEFQIAAAAGYVVVGPNPRGSDGYGVDHARCIGAAYGTVDWVDVQAAADYLANRPDVDPDRLGMGGGSYGGFMTAWATARTHRFKVALVERAVINWVTMEATSDIPWFMRLELGTNTLEDIEAIRRASPITYVGDVRTPTLIVHSEEDWRCPIEQGEQWFAALRRNGVPTEFVRFPGENHELTRSGRPSLRLERFRIVHDWFADYLGGGRFVRPA